MRSITERPVLINKKLRIYVTNYLLRILKHMQSLYIKRDWSNRRNRSAKQKQ